MDQGDSALLSKLQEHMLNWAYGRVHRDVKFEGLESAAASLSKILEGLACSVARQYASGAISFENADAIMNEAWQMALRLADSLPLKFVEVYLAFDAGETHAPGDNMSEDPRLKHTLPLILEFLRAEEAQARSGTGE